jgi:hypothetical protein
LPTPKKTVAARCISPAKTWNLSFVDIVYFLPLHCLLSFDLRLLITTCDVLKHFPYYLYVRKTFQTPIWWLVALCKVHFHTLYVHYFTYSFGTQSIRHITLPSFNS